MVTDKLYGISDLSRERITSNRFAIKGDYCYSKHYKDQ
jgi:hypothetical protein